MEFINFLASSLCKFPKIEKNNLIAMRLKFVFYYKRFLEEYLGILSTTPSLMILIDRENKNRIFIFYFF